MADVIAEIERVYLKVAESTGYLDNFSGLVLEHWPAIKRVIEAGDGLRWVIPDLSSIEAAEKAYDKARAALRDAMTTPNFTELADMLGRGPIEVIGFATKQKVIDALRAAAEIEKERDQINADCKRLYTLLNAYGMDAMRARDCAYEDCLDLARARNGAQAAYFDAKLALDCAIALGKGYAERAAKLGADLARTVDSVQEMHAEIERKDSR